MRGALPIKAAAADLDPDHVLDLRKVCKQFGTDPAVDALVDVDLVLASLARGAYQLRVTATDGTNTDARSIGLAVK